MARSSFNVIGLMSGTSMDGVDLAYCHFRLNSGKWNYELLFTDCIPYTGTWHTRLDHLTQQSAETFAKTHVFYGHYLGQLLDSFIRENKIKKLDFISSHGQTVFHNPKQGYTVQIGSGAAIAAECGIAVVCDLRATDMAYGGQGAPIVPVGEKYLFPDYQLLLNIGGISNISVHSDDEIIGYDCGSGNILLDYYANEAGKMYDEDGEMARSGSINAGVLKELNGHEYFSQTWPKTLHADWVLDNFLPVIEKYSAPVEDKLATIVEHTAFQIAKAVNSHSNKGDKLLVTGGGAFNTYLTERLREFSKVEVVLPDNKTIKFKEALIMAFLGVLRWIQQPNVSASVTGAGKDSINGAVYLP